MGQGFLSCAPRPPPNNGPVLGAREGWPLPPGRRDVVVCPVSMTSHVSGAMPTHWAPLPSPRRGPRGSATRAHFKGANAASERQSRLSQQRGSPPAPCAPAPAGRAAPPPRPGAPTDMSRWYSSRRCRLDAMNRPPFCTQPVCSPVSSGRSRLTTRLVWASSSTSTSLGRSCHSRPGGERGARQCPHGCAAPHRTPSTGQGPQRQQRCQVPLRRPWAPQRGRGAGNDGVKVGLWDGPPRPWAAQRGQHQSLHSSRTHCVPSPGLSCPRVPGQPHEAGLFFPTRALLRQAVPFGAESGGQEAGRQAA